MKKNLIWIGLILLLLCGTLSAVDVEVEAFVDKNKIGLDDYLQLTFQVSGDKASSVRAPITSGVADFKIQGQSSSSSTNMTVVNGKMTKVAKKNYLYTMRPKRKGKLTIPSLTVTYKNKRYSSAPITIYVVEGSTEPAPQVQGNSNTQQSGKLSDNLFLVAEVNKTQVYKGEPIKVDYKILTRYDIGGMSFASEPSFEGFWKEEVYTAERVNFKPVNRGGVRFEEMLLKSLTLTANEAGRIEIPALELNVEVRTQSKSFFSFGETRSYKIKNKAVPIDVKELPTANQPTGFNGAVGSFRLNSSISQDSLKVGDSFTYTLEISGSGNINNIEIPKLPEIDHLRFLDPEVTTEMNKNKVSGKKTIKYLVVAQEQGKFEIPALKFSYFDSQRNSYKTLSTQKFKVKVAEGDLTFINSGTAQQLIAREGADIGFIISDSKLDSFNLKFNQVGYWILYLLALLTLPISALYAKEQDKLSGNVSYQRSKMANKILKKYLKQADEFAKTNSVDFYASAQTGLSSYLADKLHIARGSSTDIMLKTIKDINFPTELVVSIESIFQRYSQARFMPGGFAEENISTDYDELKRILSAITKVKI